MTPHLGKDEPPTSVREPQSSVLENREAVVAARETLQDDREDRVQKIISAADERDEEADARDALADKRDQAASLAAFLSIGHGYDVTLKARRSAAADRLDSKIDRTSSAHDRSELTDADLGGRHENLGGHIDEDELGAG